jgi:hypothetical protein
MPDLISEQLFAVEMRRHIDIRVTAALAGMTPRQRARYGPQVQREMSSLLVDVLRDMEAGVDRPDEAAPGS